ncbi:hypothetical protein MIMGU_mgv11b0173212mg, partial [Erythranthe guttata]
VSDRNVLILRWFCVGLIRSGVYAWFFGSCYIPSELDEDLFLTVQIPEIKQSDIPECNPT